MMRDKGIKLAEKMKASIMSLKARKSPRLKVRLEVEERSARGEFKDSVVPNEGRRKRLSVNCAALWMKKISRRYYG